MPGILRVKGNKIVDGDGNVVVLKGAGLGGWMNMENFITGYPFIESHHRRCMTSVLGPEKANFYFNRLLDSFFTRSDAEFFASLGLNCIRIPFNYRHFEDDMNPRVLKPEGLERLAKIIDLCAEHKIYTVLDLHAVPGGQNPDWHSDNPTNYPAFWDYKDFQDRVVWLWEILAEKFKGNEWVAGYNPINEPADREHTRLVAFYDRIEAAIRKVDPDHILFLDGNTFSMDFRAFDHILPNTVYALHDYSNMGFPFGEAYEGTPEQNDKLRAQFLRKSEFMRKHGLPIWNGEFGPVYESQAENKDQINAQREKLLGAQLELYKEYDISGWSIWLYKDIGVQGMVSPRPDTPYIRRLAPFLSRKRELQADAWGYHPNPETDAAFAPLLAWIEKKAPKVADKYPDHWNIKRHVSRLVKECLVAEGLGMEYAEVFRGMTEKELEEMADSWKFENCVLREGLNRILRKDAEERAAAV